MDNFIIETSARHVHVTREALDILFGKGFELEVKKPLPARPVRLQPEG